MPIKTRKITANQSMRLARFDTDIDIAPSLRKPLQMRTGWELEYCGRDASFLNFHQNIPAFNLHWIDLNLGASVVRGLARRRIPLPAVPRADDFALLDHSLPQRAATVQVDVIHRADRAVHVGDADGLRAARKFLRGIDSGQFRFSREFEEGHGVGKQHTAFATLVSVSPANRDPKDIAYLRA